MMNIPAFGEVDYSDNCENVNSRVVMIPNVEESIVDSYCSLFEEKGFVKKEYYQKSEHWFIAYSKGSEGIFINYFASTRQLYIVLEKDCRYFDYVDVSLGAVTTAQVTQIALEDFGMSYVIRLTDGRFIVIDGGNDFEPHREKMFQCMKESTHDGKTVVAAWFLTHPHSDHFHCFIGFVDQYGDQVEIEKVFFNFPEADDLKHYPALASTDWRFAEDISGVVNIPRTLERIHRINTRIYTPHTGQRYRIGAADCEILASMDDTIHCSDNLNATSLVIRMELAGQVILWTTDASFSIAELPKKYGEGLKADILQVPHHGFGCGEPEAEIQGYDLIQPKVCLLPVSDYNAYTGFCTWRKGTRYLMNQTGVEEIITGSLQRTITLPYAAPLYAKKELERKYLEGINKCGSCTWVYTNLSTDCQEDFQFTILNMTNVVAEVWISLYFENASQNISFIKAEVKGESVRKICIIGEDVDDDALYFNWASLRKKKVPEHVSCAVRFMSDIPVVVSHEKHEASYRV